MARARACLDPTIASRTEYQQLERWLSTSTLAPLELEAPAFPSEPGQTPPALGTDVGSAAPPAAGAAAKKRISPWLLFGIVGSLTLLGTVLTVVTKLMTIPMANYPVALTFETVFAVRSKQRRRRLWGVSLD